MPAVNYTRDVQRFDSDMATYGTTWTDAEIADILNSETQRPITIASAREHFGEAKWWQHVQSGWSGLFQDYKTTSGVSQVEAFLEDAWSVVYGESGRTDLVTTIWFKPNGKLQDANRQGCTRWAAFFNWALSSASPPEQSDIDSFYGFGSGLKYPLKDVTAADVAASRTTNNDDETLKGNKQKLKNEYNRLYNIHIAPLASSQNPLEVTDQAMKDALTSMSSEWVDQIV